jgi:hypothetical protein
MLIITAINVTTNKTGEKVLQRFTATSTKRDQGASALLRHIADAIDASQKKKKK